MGKPFLSAARKQLRSQVEHLIESACSVSTSVRLTLARVLDRVIRLLKPEGYAEASQIYLAQEVTNLNTSTVIRALRLLEKFEILHVYRPPRRMQLRRPCNRYYLGSAFTRHEHTRIHTKHWSISEFWQEFRHWLSLSPAHQIPIDVDLASVTPQGIHPSVLTGKKQVDLLQSSEEKKRFEGVVKNENLGYKITDARQSTEPGKTEHRSTGRPITQRVEPPGERAQITPAPPQSKPKCSAVPVLARATAESKSRRARVQDVLAWFPTVKDRLDDACKTLLFSYPPERVKEALSGAKESSKRIKNLSAWITQYLQGNWQMTLYQPPPPDQADRQETSRRPAGDRTFERKQNIYEGEDSEDCAQHPNGWKPPKPTPRKTEITPLDASGWRASFATGYRTLSDTPVVQQNLSTNQDPERVGAIPFSIKALLAQYKTPRSPRE